MKELFKRIKNHIWPHQYNLLSIIEIVLYLVVLVFVFNLYKAFQSVPMHRDTITIERINTCNSSKDYLSKVDVTLFTPMSYVLDNDSLVGSITVKTKEYPRSTNDTVFPIKENGSYEDSLHRQYNSFFPTPRNVLLLYYVRTAVEYGVRRSILLNKKAPIIDTVGNTVTCIHKEDNHLVSECYHTGSRSVSTKDTESWFISGPYSKPSKWSLYDLSQSYYNINLISNLDEICFSLDFVGAVVFSNMYPTPDIVTMNSIRFENPDKIKEIKEHGLSFHARFIELESKQNVRLFCITAIMSAITTVFIGLLVLIGSKVLRKLLQKKKAKTEQPENKGSSQIEAENNNPQ